MMTTPAEPDADDKEVEILVTFEYRDDLEGGMTPSEASDLGLALLQSDARAFIVKAQPFPDGSELR